jgi:hypothetical protein
MRFGESIGESIGECRSFFVVCRRTPCYAHVETVMLEGMCPAQFLICRLTVVSRE